MAQEATDFLKKVSLLLTKLSQLIIDIEDILTDGLFNQTSYYTILGLARGLQGRTKRYGLDIGRVVATCSLLMQR